MVDGAKDLAFTAAEDKRRAQEQPAFYGGSRLEGRLSLLAATVEVFRGAAFFQNGSICHQCAGRPQAVTRFQPNLGYPDTSRFRVSTATNRTPAACATSGGFSFGALPQLVRRSPVECQVDRESCAEYASQDADHKCRERPSACKEVTEVDKIQPRGVEQRAQKPQRFEHSY